MPRPRKQVAVRTIPDATRCIVYTRVSTVKQAAEEKASLDDQLARCLTLAKEGGHDAPYVVADEGLSAFKENGRLESLVAWCEAHERGDFQHRRGLIVSFTHSRFSRIGGLQTATYVQRLRTAGWNLKFVLFPSTGQEEMDDAFMMFLFALARMESVEKQHRSRVGRRGNAALGKWSGGFRTPFGYALDPASKKLVPHREHAAMMGEAFATFADGRETLSTIAGWIGRTPTAVRFMFQSQVYLGAMDYGRRAAEGEPRIVTDDAHPALVDQRTWDRAQARLAANGPRGTPPEGALPLVLSGLAQCTCALDDLGEPRLVKRRGEVVDERPGGDPATVKLRALCGGSAPGTLRNYVCKRCSGCVRQAALELKVFEALADELRKRDRAGVFERATERWIADQLARSDVESGEAKQRALKQRKQNLMPLVAEGDQDALASVRGINAELRALATALAAGRPDPRAIRREAAESLAGFRRAFSPKLVTHEVANAALAKWRHMLKGILWDRDARVVTVTFGLTGPLAFATVEGRQRRQPRQRANESTT